MTEQPILVILAAGMGSRYGGLKQMDPMGPSGEFVIDYSIYDAIRAGFSKVVFVIREEFYDAFRQSIGARFAGQIEVSYAFQSLTDLPEGFNLPEGREKPWGTAHAVWAARDELDRPFAVINADDFYGQDAYQQAAGFLQSLTVDVARYGLVAYRVANTLSTYGTVNRGLCQTDAGVLLSVEEILKIQRHEDGVVRGERGNGESLTIADEAEASMNFWCFAPSFLTHLEEHFIAFLREHGDQQKSECYIPTVVDDLIRAGQIQCDVLQTSSSWFGVTYPEDKPFVVGQIQGLVDDGVYPVSLLGSR